jgi:hypothetical protein
MSLAIFVRVLCVRLDWNRLGIDTKRTLKMADKTSDLPARGGDAAQDRVQELTWALIDDQISEDEMQLLDSLLLSDEAARDTYIGCVQMHTDLLAHYADDVKRPFPGGKLPVLGFLGEGVPPFDVQPSQ